VLALALLIAGAAGAGLLSSTPVAAGYDDYSREREEARRERERQRAEREEARRQRQAEREAERAAREREREEARRQREQEKSERKETRSFGYDGNTGNDSYKVSNPAPTYAAPTQPATNSQNNAATSRTETRTQSGGDSGRNSAQSNRNSQQKDERRDTVTKTRENEKDKRDSDNGADDDEEKEREDIAIPEPEEPPRTLVEWLNRVGSPAKPAKADTASKPEAAPVSQVKATSTRQSGKTDTAKPAAGKNATSKPSKPTKTAASTNQAGPRRNGFDAELLRLGEVRRREILATGLDQASLSKARAMGFKPIASAPSPGSSTPVMTLTVPAGMTEVAAKDWLDQALPNARFGPNHVYHIHPAAQTARAASSTPKAGSCGGPDCFAERLLRWNKSLSACASGVRIGVIDTSFDMGHPALKGREHELKDFRSNPMDAKSDWHGTAVLSVLAGDASSSTPGIVPGARFLLASTFGAGQDGQASADALSVLAALSWLDGKVDIINMSFSGPRNDEIELAIRAMAVKGVVFVAAAGNRGPNGPASYPAAYPDVIAVTAVAQDRRGYRHATHGDYVDMAAPGVDVFTALPMGKTGLRTGTSFAAPFVTGLLAAMPAARKGIQTKSDLLTRISTEDLGAPGRDPVFGEGLPMAPGRCDEIGGVASLPWSPEAQRMSLGASRTSLAGSSSTFGFEASPASSMGAFGFAP
jgi:hypothetical protein